MCKPNPARSKLLRFCDGDRLFRFDRQNDADGGSPARLTLSLDAAPVHLGDMLND